MKETIQISREDFDRLYTLTVEAFGNANLPGRDVRSEVLEVLKLVNKIRGETDRDERLHVALNEIVEHIDREFRPNFKPGLCRKQ